MVLGASLKRTPAATGMAVAAIKTYLHELGRCIAEPAQSNSAVEEIKIPDGTRDDIFQPHIRE